MAMIRKHLQYHDNFYLYMCFPYFPNAEYTGAFRTFQMQRVVNSSLIYLVLNNSLPCLLGVFLVDKYQARVSRVSPR